MISNELTDTLRMNLGQEALNLESFSKVDATLLQFYEHNLR